MLKNAAIAALLLGACLQAAAQPQPASDYNRGVDAYRTKDYAAARRHWQKAVEQGDIDAHNNLGYLLYNGLGGEQDPARAVSLWQQASMKGQRESQWHLGF
jgi:TPR repeat protein